MSGIVTLTMNPAIDISTSTDHVEPVTKLRCGPEQRDPGGGGINVARAAGRLGAEVTAVYPVGGFVGQLLKRLVDDEGIMSLAVPVSGETREDLTVLDKRTGEQYRFVMSGPHMADAEWKACLKVFSGIEVKPDYVCASGSLPPGVPDDFFATVAGIVAGWGARFVLDSSGEALRSALSKHVYLVKPNLREICELTGLALQDRGSLIKACRGLIEGGSCEVVALTLGADGALLVSADRAWRAAALPIQPVSTVGAGDSFLGGMIWALAAKMTLEESFRYAVACGSAALLAPGTELYQAEDVRRLLDQVTVEDISEQEGPWVLSV